MRLLADTANLRELEALQSMKLIDGVTTNPSIISREGQDSLKVLDAICKLLPYSVFEKTFTMPEPLTQKYVDNFKNDWDNAGCFIRKQNRGQGEVQIGAF